MERDLATMEKTERVLQRELEMLRSEKDEWNVCRRLCVSTGCCSDDLHTVE